MAKDLNKVQMTGRLGADPEMRYTPQGNAVTTFRVASNRTWRNPEGETQEDTEWFRVVAWNRLAEICHQWLSKGSRVYVEGRMQTRQWQDQEGQNRSLSEVIANDIIILEARRDHQAAEHPEPAPRPAEARAGAARPARAAPAAAPPAEVAVAGERPAPPAAKAARVAALPPGEAAFEEEELPF
jgi:single-strand DNA-binding protein